jgi:hypothetical protein
MIHNIDYYRKIQGVNNAKTAFDAETRLLKAELDGDFSYSIDCESVRINGSAAELLVTRAQDQAVKNIVARPDKPLFLGDIVEWCSTFWIVDTIDADNRIATRGKMKRCNVVLKWLDENGVVRSYPGFCEDATKYGDGLSGNKMLTLAEFQIKVKVRLDEHTVKINREKRFLLDASQYVSQMEANGDHPSAYMVSRRNVLTGSHNGHGYVELTMLETAYSQNDNPIMMIADYYNADDSYVVIVSNSDGSLNIAKGKSYQLSATATKNGIALSAGEIQYQSSDTSVAAVTAAGKITGVANGSCVITVRAGNSKSEINVTVKNIADQIVVSSANGEMEVVYGQTLKVLASAFSDGVKSDVPLTFAVTSETASNGAIIESGDGYAIVKASNNASFIGKTIDLNVSGDGIAGSVITSIPIRGWF